MSKIEKYEIYEVMWVGVGDQGQLKYWPSLSTNKMDCKMKIYDWLYAPLKEKPDWTDWEFFRVEIKTIDSKY